MERATRRTFLQNALLATAGVALSRPGRVDAAPVIHVEDYRSKVERDATMTLRRAIEAAKTRGGGRVVASPGKVYDVRPAGTFQALTPTGGVTAYAVCLQIPAGVVLDMRGSVLRLRGNQEAVIAANGNLTGEGPRDSRLGLHNAVIDGGTNRPASTSLLHFAHLDQLSMQNVTIIRGYYVGGWIYDCRHSHFTGINVEGFTGQPWTFGSPVGIGNEVADTSFGTLRARNVRKIDNAFLPGNSFDLILARCQIARVEARDCAAGVKLQWPSSDVAVAAVVTARCGDADGNSGLKIQGDANGGPVTRITVASIVATDQTGPGVFMDGSVDCTVGSFLGDGNNRNGDRGDVWIGGIRDSIHRISSSRSGGNGIVIRDYAQDYSLGEVEVISPGRSARATGTNGVAVFGGTGRFGDVVCVDRTAKRSMARAVDVSSPSAVGSIDSLTVKGRRVEPFKSNSPQFGRPPTLDYKTGIGTLRST